MAQKPGSLCAVELYSNARQNDCSVGASRRARALVMLLVCALFKAKLEVSLQVYSILGKESASLSPMRLHTSHVISACVREREQLLFQRLPQPGASR